ncbi:hypothetical protein RHOFW104T7_12715 [Rhodanobacter thiooxydans]|uniref:Uncharacterized protein n=1 Tax=Rhodanobacter thiooxydans TaxID=416169 RepID=A0A154QIC1_9GAMM|nr:hypothetical protein [Rhodanobacter thiooxydans]EIM01618.1 hypothetical protein UUA_03733 [Rhodanobacter thiooxydans LCS2]KZC23603.1 hypothetical protein RHOFW104T7_12715 [Rhodanobacter thiooxydans]MCW0201733.1 hypothetical protein [Rhodanobacter thiooxydans]
MNLRRDLGAMLKTVVVIALVCYASEAFLYGFSGMPEKSALREMKGTYVRQGVDAMIEVAMPQDEIRPHLFTLYPRTASSGDLQPGEPLTLLVSHAGVIVQIEAAVSGVHKSYEEERQRHRRVLSLSTLASALALLGIGLLYVASGANRKSP